MLRECENGVTGWVGMLILLTCERADWFVLATGLCSPHEPYALG